MWLILQNHWAPGVTVLLAMFWVLFLLQKLFLVYTFLKSLCWNDFYFWSQFTTKNISSLTLSNCCFGQNFANFKYFPELVKRAGTLFPLLENCYLFTSFPQLSVWSLTKCLVSHFRGLFKKSPLTGFECRHKLPFFSIFGGKMLIRVFEIISQ